MLALFGIGEAQVLKEVFVVRSVGALDESVFPGLSFWDEGMDAPALFDCFAVGLPSIFHGETAGALSIKVMKKGQALQGVLKYLRDGARRAFKVDFGVFHSAGQVDDGDFVLKAGIPFNGGQLLDVHLGSVFADWQVFWRLKLNCLANWSCCEHRRRTVLELLCAVSASTQNLNAVSFSKFRKR